MIKPLVSNKPSLDDEIFGDPDFKMFSINQIKEILDNAKINSVYGVDEAFGGDLYTAGSVMKSLVHFIESHQTLKY